MTDSAKALALSGDKPSQLLWLTDEVHEFKKEPLGTLSSFMEFLDVLGCIAKFDIDLDEETALSIGYISDQKLSETYWHWSAKQRSRGRDLQPQASLLKANHKIRDIILQPETGINGS